ncbi:hypothetical protein BU17DRAFT_66131 [Hysterangium stoloniferum]|nr:hypothetical protein BU17DRAFT_66131 [Hysterangium stoloniferum]
MYGENCAQRRYKMMVHISTLKIRTEAIMKRRLSIVMFVKLCSEAMPDKVTNLSTLSADAVKTCGDNETMKWMRLRARLRIMIAERRNLNKGVPLPSMSRLRETLKDGGYDARTTSAVKDG